VLVDSARVEVEHMKLTNSNGSGFIPLEDKTPRAVEPGAPRLVAGKAQSGSR
jgi:hypothetical protein